VVSDGSLITCRQEALGVNTGLRFLSNYNQFGSPSLRYGDRLEDKTMRFTVCPLVDCAMPMSNLPQELKVMVWLIN